MNGWTTLTFTARRPGLVKPGFTFTLTDVDEHPNLATCGYAQHLRGRVVPCRRGWRFEVINHHTGAVVTQDSPFATFEAAMDQACHVTMAARVAWMRGFKRKALQ